MTSDASQRDRPHGPPASPSVVSDNPRVVLVVPGFPKGSETFIFNKAVGLVGRGWDVRIACAASVAAEWANYPAAEAELVRARVEVGAPHRPLRAALAVGPRVVARSVLSAPRESARYIWRGWRRFGLGVVKRFYGDCHIVAARPDILHFEFGSLAAERMYLRDLIGCRVSVSFRGYDLEYVGLDQPGFYDEVWRQADAFHFLGHALVELAHQRGAPASIRPTLISPAIDTDRFAPPDREPVPAGTPERPLRLLTVGRLHWKKGYEYGLDAVRVLVERGVTVEYRIVGDGDYWEAVHFWRHQNGLDADVEVLGSVRHKAVVDQMTWADLLVHPAVTEAFGNAVIEAQAMALAVVCTDAGGLPENVEAGVTGLVVPRRDPDALADAIESLAKDADRRIAMGRAGRRRVLEHFGLDEQLDAIEAFYRTAVGA